MFYSFIWINLNLDCISQDKYTEFCEQDEQLFHKNKITE